MSGRATSRKINATFISPHSVGSRQWRKRTAMSSRRRRMKPISGATRPSGKPRMLELNRTSSPQSKTCTAIAPAGGEMREMYRKVADLYAKMRDPLNALINVSAALQYDSTDADLLRKRDSYYYSVPIDRLERAKQNIGSWFDVGYCVRKAMSVLNTKDADAELLDWATHLTRLAKVMEPKSNRVRLVEARCLLRQGNRDGGLSLLEDIHESEKGSGDEEEAWYNTSRLLGQLYLEELNQPALALKAYSDYKEFHKSGADTLFQIARCYEALNDPSNAAKFYNAVTAFEEHPRYWDAKEALKRLGKG